MVDSDKNIIYCDRLFGARSLAASLKSVRWSGAAAGGKSKAQRPAGGMRGMARHPPAAIVASYH